MMDINERRIIQEIKTIATTPAILVGVLYWNTANSYWKEKSNE